MLSPQMIEFVVNGFNANGPRVQNRHSKNKYIQPSEACKIRICRLALSVFTTDSWIVNDSRTLESNGAFIN